MTETAFPDEKLWNRPFCHCTAPTIMANVPKRQDFRKSWHLMPLSSPPKLNCTEASAQTLLLLAWLSIWNRKTQVFWLVECQAQLSDQPSRTSLRISGVGCRISHINQIACSTVHNFKMIWAKEALNEITISGAAQFHFEKCYFYLKS